MACFHDLIPTLTVLLAFILSLLCLFSGSDSNFLTKADIVTLETSNIGNGAGIRDFYSVYVMTYCEGFMEQCSTNGTEALNFVRNVTFCSDRAVPFAFDAGTILSNDIHPEDPAESVSDLNWPDFPSDDFDFLAPTSQAMVVFYVAGTAAAGLAILYRIWITWGGHGPRGFQAPGEVPGTPREIVSQPRRSKREMSLMMVSLSHPRIASTIASVIATEFVNLVNNHGRDNGISANHGDTFLAMSWTAVALLFIGSMDSLYMVMVWHYRHCTCEQVSPLDPEAKRPPPEDF
ncbi:hypothetical protein MW887_005803 [Aspergillus wentii]|nr:hypothetical protein MW887_005803 [Aspergillus wentii]